MYYAERGDTPKLKIVTKDEDGNKIDPDADPVCKVYLGTKLIDTLSVSNPTASTYVAHWAVPNNAELDKIHVAEWTWTYSSRPYVARDKIYVHQTGLKGE